MQSPLGKSALNEKSPGLGLDTLCRSSFFSSPDAALIGPVERQIEFGKTRRGEFDGLPALQDRLNQLGAEKGEVDKPPNIATGDAVAFGQFLQRSGASGGKLLEPRAPALISVGLHLDRSFYIATPAAPASFRHRSA